MVKVDQNRKASAIVLRAILGRAQFHDARAAGSIPAPSISGDVLPEVSFGYLLDKCCDLIVWVGGPDPREYVTQWIAGDVGKASLQAEAWEHLSVCVDSVQRNLDAGLSRIGQTWAGGAAQNAAARTTSWIEALATQSTSCTSLAGHLRDMVEQAVQMAQVVVDIIKTVVSIVTAALSSAYIPGWGQWKAIKTVKDCAAGAVLVASVAALCVAAAFVYDLALR